MADTDNIVDHLLRHAAGAPMRTMFGRLGNWALEGAVTDSTRGSKIPKVVAVMALDAGNALTPILKKVGLNYKSWQVAEGILKAARLILREAEWRINIPTSLLSVWTVAVGYAADSGYEGWLEGTMLRAGDTVAECGREIKKKLDKRREKNEEFTNKDREKVIRKVVGDEAYEAAHKKILPEFFADLKNLLKGLGVMSDDDKKKDKDKSGESHDSDTKKSEPKATSMAEAALDGRDTRLLHEYERAAAEDGALQLYGRMIWEPLKPLFKVLLYLSPLIALLILSIVLHNTTEIDGYKFFGYVLVGVLVLACIVLVLLRVARSRNLNGARPRRFNLRNQPNNVNQPPGGGNTGLGHP